MPNVYLSPVFNGQTTDDNGNLASGFKLYTYAAGTTTPRATYTDQTGASTQANPIVLNARGEPASPIWVLAGETKFVLKTAADVEVRTIDDVAGIGTFGGGSVDVNEADILNVDQIVGGTATAVTVNGTVLRWQNNGTTAATASNGVGRFSGDTSGPTLSGYKSRHATVGSHTIVQSGDELLTITALGSNGTTFDPAGYIKFLSGGTPGAAADMPGRFQIAVSADASATPTVRFDMASTGFVTMSAYTSGRVPYFSTGGLMTNSANMTFDGANFSVSTTPVAGCSVAVVNNTSGIGAISGVGGGVLYGTLNNPTFNCWNQLTAGDNAFIGFFTEGGGGTSRGGIDYNRAGAATRYNTTSDYRLKTLFGNYTGALDLVRKLKVYDGIMDKAGATQRRPMMVAHEAQEIAPYAVTGKKDNTDKDGNPIYQGMDHQLMVPLIVAALQETAERVSALEAA